MIEETIIFHNDVKFKSTNAKFLEGLELLFIHSEIEILYPYKKRGRFILNYNSFVNENDNKHYLELKELALKYDIDLIYCKTKLKSTEIMEKEISNIISDKKRNKPNMNLIIRNAIIDYNSSIVKSNEGKKNKRKLIMLDKYQLLFLENVINEVNDKYY